MSQKGQLRNQNEQSWLTAAPTAKAPVLADGNYAMGAWRLGLLWRPSWLIVSA
jgi:hypothetical protein